MDLVAGGPKVSKQCEVYGTCQLMAVVICKVFSWLTKFHGSRFSVFKVGKYSINFSQVVLGW